MLKVIRKVMDFVLALVGVIVGIVWGTFKRYVAAAIGFGLIALAVASYTWVSSEYFPSVEVLVVDACSPDGCEWQTMGEDAFADREYIWAAARESGHYVSWNTTGQDLVMTPVLYGRGRPSGASQKPFKIPEGWSVQTTKPNFLMTASPDTIETYSVTGARSNETLLRWELTCGTK